MNISIFELFKETKIKAKGCLDQDRHLDRDKASTAIQSNPHRDNA